MVKCVEIVPASSIVVNPENYFVADTGGLEGAGLMLREGYRVFEGQCIEYKVRQFHLWPQEGSGAR
jgi:hypothetical protein